MADLVTIAIVILLTVQISGQILLAKQKNASYTMSECLIYIFNKYFINSTKIFLQFSNQESSLLADLTRSIDLPIVINLEEKETEGIDKRIPNNVIVSESNDILKCINESKWTPTTQFLIITNESQTELKMIDIFQQFWDSNIVNVLLLAPKNVEIHIYTFIPFNPHDCAIHKPVLLAKWVSGRITPATKLIQKERVANLNGCTLNATVIGIPPMILFPNSSSTNGSESVSGIEGFTLMEISKKLNFKLNLALPKDNKGWGRLKPIPHGAVGDVLLKKSHFACGRLADNPDRYKYLDMSVPISCRKECLTWVTPIGAKKSLPGWVALYVKGFSNTVWCLIIATFVSAACTFRLLSKAYEPKGTQFSGTIKTIFSTIKLSLGASVQNPESSVLKLFFLAWLLYCFIIITAYQALIGSKLTVPHKPLNIETFKDLLESDLHISGVMSIFKSLTYGREEKEIKDIEKRIEDVGFEYNNIQKFFKRDMENLILRVNTAYLWSSTTVLYNTLLYPKAKGLVHILKECLYKYYAVMLLQKNCPFTPKVNRIIRALFESGIICKWRSQYAYDTPQLEPEVEKLTLNRMIGAFVILGTGLGIAFVAFLAECSFFWYSFINVRKRCCGSSRFLRRILKCKVNFDTETSPTCFQSRA